MKHLTIGVVCVFCAQAERRFTPRRLPHRSNNSPCSSNQATRSFERILGYLREAEALAAALDDPRRLGQISDFLSRHFHRMGMYDQAIVAAQSALTLATGGAEVILQALANERLGHAYHAQGDYRRAMDCLQQTVASLAGHAAPPALRSSQPACRELPCLARCVPCRVGHICAEGRALGEEGLQIAEAVAHPGSLMWASWGIGLLALGPRRLAQGTPPGSNVL